MAEHTLTVIVADDDLDDHEIIQLALRKSKFKPSVQAVYNGSQLLDLIHHRGNFINAKKVNPDFILLDINMPIMDGLQALEKLHNEKLSRKIPVYMLTTSTKDEHRVI